MVERRHSIPHFDGLDCDIPYHRARHETLVDVHVPDGWHHQAFALDHTRYQGIHARDLDRQIQILLAALRGLDHAITERRPLI
jgi:hypothetical protein